MNAYELLAKLQKLTLAGIENGVLLWIGTHEQWDEVRREEKKILLDYQLSKI